MTKQIAVHKDETHGADALWWKPIFNMQREIFRTFQRMLPENLIPATMWETGDDMLATLYSNTHSLFSQLFNNRQMLTALWMGSPMEPHIDLVEDDNGFTITASVQGLDAKDLDVSVADSALIFKGKRQQQSKLGDNLMHAFCAETFTRTLALPEEADMDQATASLEQNVLTIEIPKKSAAKTARKLVITPESEKPAVARWKEPIDQSARPGRAKAAA